MASNYRIQKVSDFSIEQLDRVINQPMLMLMRMLMRMMRMMMSFRWSLIHNDGYSAIVCAKRCWRTRPSAEHQEPSHHNISAKQSLKMVTHPLKFKESISFIFLVVDITQGSF